MSERWTSKLGRVPIGMDYVVSKEVRVGSRAYRLYKGFETFSSYSDELLSSGDRHMYEVIRDGRYSKVWFFADHDLYTDSASREWDPESYNRAVLELHSSYFGVDKSCVFVCTSHREGKMSAHVKINVDLDGGLVEARVHASRIAAICSGSYADLSPDMQVYASINQSIRAVGHSKLSADGVAKTPWPRGGQKMNHLVRRGVGSPVEIRCARPQPCAVSRRPSEGRHPGGGGDERLVRLVLDESGMSGEFGERFSAQLCSVENVTVSGSKMRGAIDGTLRRDGTLVCPFSKTVHRSNRSRFEIYMRNPSEGTVTVSCYSAKCRGQQKVRHFRIPSSAPLETP